MFSILLRALSFTFIILIGMFMKKTGMVKAGAGETVKKILINVTLPAAIIVNFSAVDEIGAKMALIVLLGLGLNILVMMLGAFCSRRKGREMQALYMLNLQGYNIGTFCLPFVQSFLPAIGTVAACMFDAGNSIMCTGGAYAFTSSYLAKEKQGFDVKSFAKKLFSSAPLVSYVGMFFLSLAGIRLPEGITQFLSPIAAANTFMAMLMLGLIFHIELRREYIKEVTILLALRYILAAVFSVVIYCFLPFELAVRQTLVLVCFAPIGVLMPAFTGKCRSDEGMAGCANSLSILCSLVFLTSLITLFGLN